MITDANKGITSVEYNHLNMPTEIKFNNSNTQMISYIYTADRTKLRKTTNDNGVVTITDYNGNYVYENNTLKQITHDQGYIESDGSSYQYVYRYIDFWGNTRITYADDDDNGSIDPITEIRTEQNYYPFGLEHLGYNNNKSGVENNLKTYQGQEFSEDLGLNTHEWKYRMSDPSIGRFWQIDPLAEDYVYNSTYAFQENKMGMGVELEGLELAPGPMGSNNTQVSKESLKHFFRTLKKLFTDNNQEMPNINGDGADKNIEANKRKKGETTINIDANTIKKDMDDISSEEGEENTNTNTDSNENTSTDGNSSSLPSDIQPTNKDSVTMKILTFDIDSSRTDSNGKKIFSLKGNLRDTAVTKDQQVKILNLQRKHNEKTNKKLKTLSKKN